MYVFILVIDPLSDDKGFLLFYRLFLYPLNSLLCGMKPFKFPKVLFVNSWPFFRATWVLSGKSLCVPMQCGAFSAFSSPCNFRVSDLTFRCLMHVDLTFVQVRYTILVPLLHEDIFSSTTCWGCCLFSNVHFWNFVKSQGVVVIWAYTLPSSLVHWLTRVNALLLLLPRLCRVAQSQV